jgi:transcriptional regulator with XRE-family HTH domain
MSTKSLQKIDKKFQEFKELLEEVLRTEGISAIELAERMDKHRSQISRYMTDDSEKRPQPSRKTIRQMNDVLDSCTISELEDGWKLSRNHNTLRAIRMVEKVEEAAGVYTNAPPDEVAAIRQIQFAQRLLERALEVLMNRPASDRLNGDEE